MTRARRPDGSGGPLAADERIDDIQFYIPAEAELLIDDIVLYDAAPEVIEDARPFPSRVIFTGWFDTGVQGKEWPGDFGIVPHEKPHTWDAAKAVPNQVTGTPWIRIDLRGERPLGRRNALALRYRLSDESQLHLAVCRRTHDAVETVAEHVVERPTKGRWAETRWEFDASPGQLVTEIQIHAASGVALLVDDVLLFEPGQMNHDLTAPTNP